MSALTDRQSALIADLCRRYRVARLELFGSATRKDFDPECSDYDFLVEFLPLEPGKNFDTYFGLLEGWRRRWGGTSIR